MRWSWSIGLSCLVACSWLVDPESLGVRCAVGKEGKDPCAPGFICTDGLCAAKCAMIAGEPDPCQDGGRCVKGVCLSGCEDGERCGDGMDNDCDGMTDEGHDPDGDGHTWCGDPTLPNGGPEADCDVKDPTRYGGAREVCDGKDNNCDGVTDEDNDDGPLCENGEECLGQHCVVPTCAVPEAVDKACRADETCNIQTGTCGPNACKEPCDQPGEYCDQTTGECRSVGKDNGEPCVSHTDCLSASCIASGALRLTVSSSRVCMQTCCRDSDCPDSQRCFASGTGARSCLPESKVPRPDGASTLCTLDDQCTSGQSCGLAAGQDIVGSIVQPRTNLTTSVCRTISAGEGPLGASCSSGTDCRSQACVLSEYDSFSAKFVCSQMCRTSADCTSLVGSASGTVQRPSYCKFVSPNGRSGNDYVSVCMISDGETGAGDLGARCLSGSSCKDGACVGASANSSGVCAPTCCNDSQCGMSGGTVTRCRPVASGGDHYETRCVQ